MLMKILVVDDNEVNRRLLSSILTRKHYDVLEANSGFEAIDLFKQHSPDLVLMDIMMPGMDGRQCAAELKRIAGDVYIPIIYVTALSEDSALSIALDAGGDDFVSKPINFDILLSKITAHSRIQELNAELGQKNRQIAKYNAILERDQELASHFFERALKHNYLHQSVIRHHLSPATAFNGDILMAAPRQGGGLYLILGDFTGHGLAAAIGSLPVSQTFFSMAKRACWIGDIAKALNRELADLLPVDMFLAATLIELNSTGERLQAWAGGLPDGYLFDPATHNHRLIKSTHPPLGILSDENFNPACQSFSVTHGERVYLYTDGVIETRNSTGEIYGEQRLHELLNNHKTELFDHVISDIQEFIGDKKQTDDTSFVELTCKRIFAYNSSDTEPPQLNAALSEMPYHLRISLTDDLLKNNPDIVTYMSEMICATTLAQYKGLVHTILAEMYTNILEHGVLRLNSVQKDEERGFSTYYEDKQAMLNNLNDMCIDINVSYHPDEKNKKLVISMSHNRDTNHEITTTVDDAFNESPHGRGMLLLNNLCEQVKLSRDGKNLEVTYRI